MPSDRASLAARTASDIASSSRPWSDASRASLAVTAAPGCSRSSSSKVAVAASYCPSSNWLSPTVASAWSWVGSAL